MHERVLPVCIGACVFLQCVLSYILCCIDHFGNYHNTLCLSPKILHKHCFQFQIKKKLSENKNNAYANFGGTSKEYYGIFQNSLLCCLLA